MEVTHLRTVTLWGLYVELYVIYGADVAPSCKAPSAAAAGGHNPTDTQTRSDLDDNTMITRR